MCFLFMFSVSTCIQLRLGFFNSFENIWKLRLPLGIIINHCSLSMVEIKRVWNLHFEPTFLVSPSFLPLFKGPQTVPTRPPWPRCEAKLRHRSPCPSRRVCSVASPWKIGEGTARWRSTQIEGSGLKTTEMMMFDLENHNPILFLSNGLDHLFFYHYIWLWLSVATCVKVATVFYGRSKWRKKIRFSYGLVCVCVRVATVFLRHFFKKMSKNMKAYGFPSNSINIPMNLSFSLSLYIIIYTHLIPVVPHKAVAEVLLWWDAVMAERTDGSKGG